MSKFQKLPLLRSLLLAGTYAAVAFISLWLSLLLRFDFDVPQEYWKPFLVTLLWLVPLKLAMLLAFGQFRSLLTFFSLSDAKRLILAMGAAAVAAIGVWHLSKAMEVVPRAVILTDFLLSVTGLAVIRTGMRIYRERFSEPGGITRTRRKKTAIIGAGSAGSALFREIQSKAGLGMEIVCFIDDDAGKIGGTLHGRKIAGSRADLPMLVDHLQIARAIIAMPGASPAVIRETVGILNQAGIEHDILPSVTQLLHKEVSVSHLRHVNPEDLLGRDQVRLDEAGIKTMVSGKVIMVTGAGGSIGSELCRQIGLLGPSKLLLIERGEPALFQIEQELRNLYPGLALEPFSTNVTQPSRMGHIFETFRPDLVFHAAAHKHVPLMESQPLEAIFNNSYGTQVVASLAAVHGTKKFVLVSTDKAVNPTNVMGATKRLAELVVSETQNTFPETRFAAVRFGNVLGSSGSVIPTFRRQIAGGGPVCVTHPEITRYFMSIPEAVGLVLQCAWQAKGGEVFVLDMGEPVKIVDLARQMIELSGLKPDEDIAIEYTGLRPGEKLFEEPIHKNENVSRTAHPKILILRDQRLAPDANVVDDLLLLAGDPTHLDGRALKEWLATRVPEYAIWNG